MFFSKQQIMIKRDMLKFSVSHIIIIMLILCVIMSYVIIYFDY